MDASIVIPHDTMSTQNKVQILDHSVTISFDSVSEWTPGGMGRADVKILKVNVSSDLHSDIQKSTLVHELLHIICDILSVELEENEIDAIALGVYSLIKNNKHLTDWIQTQTVGVEREKEK